MAEVKNSFLRSKMNKDLDARLLPNGEYRDALNVSISKSENSNVGALENIEGNNLTVKVGKELGTLSGVTDLKIIGQYTDEPRKIIYLFLTNYTGNSIAYSSTAVNWICSFNLQSLEFLVYSTGAFLNFSTQNTILSVNLLESILYWTDNRNQPRKINVLNSLNVNQYPAFKPFYTNEDQISVAKVAPYLAMDLYKANGAIEETTLVNATSVALPQQFQADAGVVSPENQTIPISNFSGDDINSLVGFYVWSSDGQLGETEGVTVQSVGVSTVNISKLVVFSTGHTPVLYFAKANPKYNELYPGDATFLEDRFARFSYRYKFLDGEFSIMAPFTQTCFIPKQYGFFLEDDEKSTYESTVVDFMQNQVNQILLQLRLPGKSNELLSTFLIEEIEILYKESDGTSVSVVDTITANQLTNNGVDTTYEYDYQSTEPFKTLPELQTTRVYDKTPVKAFCQEIISNRIVYSNYQNKHTPPSTLDYNVGVGDKFGNSVAQSNKSYVAYPNHTLKQNRTYQVGVVLADKYGRQSTVVLSSNQSDLNNLGNTSFGGDTFYSSYRSNSTSETSVLEWPGDSIKVLFNSIIKSNKSLATTAGGGQPGLYDSDQTSSKYNPTGWYSYKIVVKQTEQEYYNVYLPGILNGLPEQATQFTANNPQGSIATVTLLSDNINKVPRDLSEVGPDQRQFRSSVRMWGRVSPQLLGIGDSFPTAIPTYNQQYYPDLIADTVASISTQKDMFSDVGVTADFVDIYEFESNPILGRISTVKNIGSTGGTTDPYPFFLAVYETEPTTSRIDIYWETSTSGLISELNNLIETSIPGIPGNFSQLGWDLREDRDFTATNALGQGKFITDAFWPVDIFNTPIVNSSISNFEVRGNGGNASIPDPRFFVFTIPIGDADPYDNVTTYSQVAYRIFVISNFVYLESSNDSSFTGNDNFEISAVVSNTDPALTTPLVNTLFESESLANFTPNFGNPEVTPPAPSAPPLAEYTWPYNSFGSVLVPAIFTDVFTPAQNGSALTGSKQLELRWVMVVKQFGIIITNVLSIDDISGRITIDSGAVASGQYDLTVTLIDAAGFGIDLSFSSVFIFGETPVNCQFNQSVGEVEFDSGTESGFVNTNQELGYGAQTNLGNAGLVFWSSTTTSAFGEQILNWNSDYVDFVPVINPIEPVPAGELQTVESSFPTAGYNTKSINLGNGPDWCTSGNAGLTQGTGYIIVTLRIINTTPNYNNLDLTSDSLIVLQRRKPNTSQQWTTVSDIENVPCSLTGSWRTRVFAEGEVSDGGNLQQGSLVSVPAGDPLTPNEMTGAIVSPIQTPNPAPAICVSRAFAINSINNGGDLRLSISKLLTNFPISQGNPAKISVSISYGDFYYPNQQNHIAYSYRLYNVGQQSAAHAKNIQVAGFSTVYAREPLMKYVSQFYEDPELTDPKDMVIVNNNDWFLYQPNASPLVGSYSPIQVNESFPDNSALLNGSTLSQFNRRYVARFNITGAKQGLSQPRELGN